MLNGDLWDMRESRVGRSPRRAYLYSLNPAKLQGTMKACALSVDLKQLSEGSKTEIEGQSSVSLLEIP
jgi:hypothetical protein